MSLLLLLDLLAMNLPEPKPMHYISGLVDYQALYAIGSPYCQFIEGFR